MKRKVHVILGATLGASIAAVLGASRLDRLVGLVWGAIGGYVPDLDLRRRHRVLLHNISSAAAFAIVAVLATRILFGDWFSAVYGGLGYLVGHLSHVLTDMLTEKGVAFLYPYSDRRYSIAKFKSDNEMLNGLFALLAAFLAFLALTG